MPTLQREFVTQFRAAMRARGVTSAELARRIKWSRARMSQALRTNSNLTIKTMTKLANALDAKIRLEVE